MPSWCWSSDCALCGTRDSNAGCNSGRSNLSAALPAHLCSSSCIAPCTCAGASVAGLTSAVLPLLQADDENLLPSPRSSQAVLPAHMGSPRALLPGQGSEFEGHADSETVKSSASEAEYDADFVETASPRPVSRPDMRLPSQGGLVSSFAAWCMKWLLSKGRQMVCLYELCTCDSVQHVHSS